MTKYLNYEKDKFRTELHNQTVNQNIGNLDEITNVNELAKKFEEIILNTVKKFTTNKMIYKNKWFNDKLNRLEKQKIELHNKDVSTKEDKHRLKILKFKNEKMFKNEVQLAKSNYLRKKIGDKKNMWKELNRIANEDNEPEKIGILFDKKLITTDTEIVELFNKYFIDSIKDIVNSISYVKFSYTGRETEFIFKFKIIDSERLMDIITSLKDKCDTNLMTARMIGDSFDIVGPVLLRIVNLSLETGTFPECWKETIVVPAEKVEGTNKCEEFRPINMLPVYEKILEQVVKQQLDEYLDDGGLLVKQQSGFRKGYSCETALNWLITEWKYEIDRNKFIFVVKLDLKRAFETVNREILLQKLQNYGIHDTECSWFQSYLERRTQRTRRNGVISNKLQCDDGVPQGSVLGPLLFNLYVNDMQFVLENCELRQYGDDTLIYTIGDNENECHELMKNNLERLKNWLCMNKLKINTKKTECMVMNCNFTTDLCIDKEKITQANEIEYLGVIIDKFLNFEKHVDGMCSKIRERANLLCNIRNKILDKDFIKIYDTIVWSQFDYCSTILFMMCNDNDIQRLQSLQDKAMRVILRCDSNTESQVMLNKLKWLSVKQKLNYHILIYIFKMNNGLLPEYLTNDKNAQNIVSIQGQQMFNNLPNDIKTVNDLKSFRTNVHQHLLAGTQQLATVNLATSTRRYTTRQFVNSKNNYTKNNHLK